MLRLCTRICVHKVITNFEFLCNQTLVPIKKNIFSRHGSISLLPNVGHPKAKILGPNLFCHLQSKINRDYTQTHYCQPSAKKTYIAAQNHEKKKVLRQFSLNWPTGSFQSISRNVRVCVCLSVPSHEVPLKCIFAPIYKVLGKFFLDFFIP